MNEGIIKMDYYNYYVCVVVVCVFRLQNYMNDDDEFDDQNKKKTHRESRENPMT